MTATDRPAPAAAAAATRPPGSLWVWLGAAIISSLGSTIMFFALNWFASGYGGRIAGLVATMSVLPSVLLLLVGGAVGDRYGPRRIMIIGDAAMIMIMSGIAVSAWLFGVSVGLLIIAGVLGGVVSAFYMPANGVFPRLFIADEELPRVLARTGTLVQIARLAGPPVGGVLVAVASLSRIAVIDALSYAVVLIVLLVVRPPRETVATKGARSLRSIVEGLRAIGQIRGMVAMLAAVSLIAGGVLPAISLCIPLSVREHGWTAASAGAIEAGWIVGGLSMSIIVSIRGTWDRAIVGLVGGPVVTAAGLVGIALAPSLVGTVAAAVVLGVGTVVFTSHVFPLFLRRSPTALQTRFQSVLVVVQMLPVLLANNAYGQLAAATSAGWSLALAAVVSLAAGGLLLATPSARSARLREAEPLEQRPLT